MAQFLPAYKRRNIELHWIGLIVSVVSFGPCPKFLHDFDMWNTGIGRVYTELNENKKRRRKKEGEQELRHFMLKSCFQLIMLF